MVQAFGFGTSTRQSPGQLKDTQLKVPGPGEYGLPVVVKRRAPSWVMGSMKRVEPGTENKITLTNPGPTAYEIPSRMVEGPRISLSPKVKGHENRFQKIVPGPGTYTPSTTKTADFSFSFGLKTQADFKMKYISSIPGPGSYDYNPRQNLSSVGASLDKSHRDIVANKTQKIVPGPGNYDPPTINLISRNSAPKYGFGTSSRLETPKGTAHPKLNNSTAEMNNSIQEFSSVRLSSPGPGQYNIKGVIGDEGQKKSIGGRFKVDLTMKEVRLKPGPGQYTPQTRVTLKTSPGFRVGTSIREKYYLKDKYKYELPPPNVYDPKLETIKRASPAAGFGYGGRSFLNKTFTAPGPGAYQTPSKIGEGPTYQIGLKLEDKTISKKASLIPSPDQYQPNFEQGKHQTSVFSIGRSRRPSISKKTLVPGPGEYYDPSAVSSFRESPKYGFGSSQRPEISEKTKAPGPGHYRLRSTFADVPTYLIPNQKDDYKFV